jgi:hypothetical protein
MITHTVSTRAGKSPWKAPSTAGYDKIVRENVIFAFSEANGWTPNMEDRYGLSDEPCIVFVAFPAILCYESAWLCGTIPL